MKFAKTGCTSAKSKLSARLFIHTDAMLFCSCGSNSTKSEITAEMAYEGAVKEDAGTIDIFEYIENGN